MKRIIIYLFAVLLTASCDNFLDVQPKGVAIPNSVDEFDKLLNTFRVRFSDFEYSSPDIKVLDENKGEMTLEQVNAYVWNPVFTDEKSNTAYDGGYADINTANVIISGMKDVELHSGNQTLGNHVLGQAYAQRALTYFLLVNAFAPQYNEAKASEDKSIPLITQSDITQGSPLATVQQVYDTIVADLKKAELLVNENPKAYLNYRASLPAVHALMAKVYMQMNRYDDALTYAKMAYEGEDFLYDYNQSGPFPWQLEKHEEQIWARYGFAYYRDYVMSEEFMDMVDQDNDMRFKKFYVDKDRYWNPLGGWRPDYGLVTSNGISTGDIYLMYAECLARSGEASKTTCLEVLNKFRQNRYTDETYEIAGSTDLNDILEIILKERRLEKPGCLSTIFDRNRYYVEGRNIEAITRTFDGESYTLDGPFNYDIPLTVQPYVE
jgi:tetratricopeptide (TPR) repeat protein